MNVYFYKKLAKTVRDKLITRDRKRANKLLDKFIRAGKNKEEIFTEIARFEIVIDIPYNIFCEAFIIRFK